MFRSCIVVLILTFSNFVLGQNIVINGGFEDVDPCPYSAGAIWAADYWNSSSASPDLFNVCGLYGYSVPQNKLGWQYPHSGNGYAGIVTYIESAAEGREIIHGMLKYPLASENQYYIEFYVSLWDSADYACHNIGVTLTKFLHTGIAINWHLDSLIYYDNHQVNPLYDKLSWVKVSGTFTARGDEEYIHLGNLRADSDSETEFVGGGGVGAANGSEYDWNLSGYFIDDVWLSHIDSAGYVGIEQTSKTTFILHPNPVTETVQIQLKQQEDVEVLVTDVLGRTVYNEVPRSARKSKMELDVSDWPNGIYLVSILNRKGIRSTQRLVVQH